MTSTSSSNEASFASRLETANGYGEIWNIVKDTVQHSINKRRDKMMLFLDDLPLQLGAYHPIGTNNIVLNRALVQIVEATIQKRQVVNALIYNLLLHEYLHSLGEYSEQDVRNMVYKVAKKCFGEKNAVTTIARKSPWVLLRGIPAGAINTSKRAMEIVKNFEDTEEYVV
jgi:hypothetical protein